MNFQEDLVLSRKTEMLDITAVQNAGKTSNSEEIIKKSSGFLRRKKAVKILKKQPDFWFYRR